jgi:hypothetical protein
VKVTGAGEMRLEVHAEVADGAEVVEWSQAAALRLHAGTAPR